MVILYCYSETTLRLLLLLHGFFFIVSIVAEHYSCSSVMFMYELTELFRESF